MNTMLPLRMSSSPASPACPAHWVYPHLRREPRAQLSSRLTSPCSFSDTHPLTPVLATLTRPSILRIPQVLCLPLLRKLPGCHFAPSSQALFIFSHLASLLPAFPSLFGSISAKKGAPTLPKMECAAKTSKDALAFGQNRNHTSSGRVLAENGQRSITGFLGCFRGRRALPQQVDRRLVQLGAQLVSLVGPRDVPHRDLDPADHRLHIDGRRRRHGALLARVSRRLPFLFGLLCALGRRLQHLLLDRRHDRIRILPRRQDHLQLIPEPLPGGGKIK